MQMTSKARISARQDNRVIIHFDYDCFYASVFEAADPRLKSRPLGVQQKQIIVTCNYEARRRGLHKLQLIRDAKRVCPDVVIMLGEDLKPFRDASKDLYAFLRGFVADWGNQAEKLGLDEVFIDASRLIDYNVELLNHNDLRNSFFVLDKQNPKSGFPYDASIWAGLTWPSSFDDLPPAPSRDDYDDANLSVRLKLASHLAQHIRARLEEEKGYTATVGISTSKLLAKLVGNVHKPRSQTTLLPPYSADSQEDKNGCRRSNVCRFLDTHDIGKIPGVGSKIAHRIRTWMAQKEDLPSSSAETVTVEDVRQHPRASPAALAALFEGAGFPRDSGAKVWGLLHGIDNTPVATAKPFPTQISIEDSYRDLSHLPDVARELRRLSCQLIQRMQSDLTESEGSSEAGTGSSLGNGVSTVGNGAQQGTFKNLRWIALPRTVRLSTRPSIASSLPNGAREYYGTRSSKSCPVPQFISSSREAIDILAVRLTREILLPQLFHKLHPPGTRWKLSLLNVAVTNMTEYAGDTKASSGRDIAKMLLGQERVSRTNATAVPSNAGGIQRFETGVEVSAGPNTQRPLTSDYTSHNDNDSNNDTDHEHDDDDDAWVSDGDDTMDSNKCICPICGASMPHFAERAHRIFHFVPD